jgi:hypothetical protein
MLKVSVVLVVVSSLWSSVAFAQAGVPNGPNSTAPAYIDLVGTRDGVPDPAGAFTVIVRDGNNAVMPSTPVRVRFGNCADLWPAAVQPYPGLTVDCAQKTVSGITDSQGAITFVIVGSVVQRTPASTANCAEIHADPGDVLLRRPSVAVYDQDGVNGIGPNDFSLQECDGLSGGLGSYFPRSDYNHNGQTYLTQWSLDFGVLHGRYLAGNSERSGARCDGQPSERLVVAQEGEARLSWGTCTAGGGTTLRTFACDTDNGTARIVGSIVAPPGVTSPIGFEAELQIVRNGGGALPDWWRFDSGACREGLLAPANVTSSTGCPAVPVGVGGQGFVSLVTYPDPTPNVERIRILGFYASPAPALTAGTEYSLFFLTLPFESTTGGFCPGCDVPVTIFLRSLRLAQGSGCSSVAGPPDVLMVPAPASNQIFWQQTFTGVGDLERRESLSLARIGANPAGSDIMVRFALRDGAPASLELFDLAGRRVRAQDVGALGAGPHQATLASRGELGPGLYFVELRQGTESRRLKVTVVR